MDETKATKLKNKLKGQFSDLSKKLKKWTDSMDLAKATKNDELISKMRSYRKECESILDKCTKITHEANQVETSENVTRNDETLTRWEKVFEAAMSAYAVAEQELATPVVPTNVGENTNTTWSRAS